MNNAAARQRNFPAAILLLLLLATSAERLTATNWADHLGVTISLSLLGAGIGLALGGSAFRRAGVYLLSLGYTLTLFPWALGVSQYPDSTWGERLANLGGRLAYSLEVFVSHKPVNDPLLFVAVAAVVFWILGLHAGFALARKSNFIGSVLPAGLVLFVVQLYDNWSSARGGLLAFYLFISLVLLGQLTFTERQRHWKDERASISASSRTDLVLGLVITSLVVVLIAWVVPTSTRPVPAAKAFWDEITQPWKNAREDLGNAVSGLNHGASIPTADIYGENMTLGWNGATGDTVLFTVRVPTTLGINRYYWVVRIYDEYINSEWHSTPSSIRSLQPRRPALLTAGATQWPTAEFIFTVPGDRLSILASPSRPVWVSRPATLTFVPISDQVLDPLMISVDPPIMPGETYTIHASVANPTERQLRSAGDVYPAWVTDRYLQLPENFPPEIPALARDITASSTTAYDKAVAITSYLRAEMHYSHSITPAPPGHEPLAWFLFTSKEGFCNYYASAEVVMLRSLGIPARLAVGFSDGQHINPDRRVIRARNAHAWPQVYFPGIGWMEFEPTASELPLYRPSGEESNGSTGILSSTPTPQGGVEPTRETSGPPIAGEEPGSGTGAPPNSYLRLIVILLVSISATLGIGLLVLFGVGEKRRRQIYVTFQTSTPVLVKGVLEALSLPIPAWLKRWERWAGMGTVERSFNVVYRGLHWLGEPSDPARTPAQSAERLTTLLPAMAASIQALLDAYQHTLFSPSPGDALIARSSAMEVRRACLRAAIQARLQKVLSFFRIR